ncbi:DUF202 domain-containing protein [Nocardia caishijiensis]|uniref:Uncharacterized protein DUF202 n=1 Tax=Nocardia caishijiensis TaxID=184756 RepID=A0ABQ6YHH9_9NOCA|nr:DUF202 domain-containing protein [Nocardia caishijiensis]KAF0845229.1 uncharacterized protein DUF202 [Nocardia caishijiensis]
MTVAVDGKHARDPGLQPERTALSWTRTSLAIMGNGLLIVGRDLVVGSDKWDTATAFACVVAILGACAVYLIGIHHGRGLGRAVPRTRAPAAIIVTGCGVVLLCASLLVCAFTTATT